MFISVHSLMYTQIEIALHPLNGKLLAKQDKGTQHNAKSESADEG